MAAVDLCTFNHELGIYIRILSLAGAREKIIEYKYLTKDLYKSLADSWPNPWLNEHKSTAAMHYFLNILLYMAHSSLYVTADLVFNTTSRFFFRKTRKILHL